jgi:hypothetical protein
VAALAVLVGGSGRLSLDAADIETTFLDADDELTEFEAVGPLPAFVDDWTEFEVLDHPAPQPVDRANPLALA